MNVQRIRLLLIEDNPGDARLVREVLRDTPEIDIHIVDRLSIGIEYLSSHETDVVLLDLGLPDSQGLDSLRTLSGVVRHVPVIVITGQEDEEIGRTAIRQGAQDYLVKPIMLGRMLVRVLHFAVERKRAEEALQHSEMQYRSLTENSPDLITRFDRQYRHLYVNPTAAKAGRYTPEEYIGKAIVEVGVPEQEAKKWEECIRTVFEIGQVIDVEDVFETPDGLKYFDTKFVPEFATDGSIHSVQSIARDITERKRAEESLRQSEERYRSIFQGAAEGILINEMQTMKIKYVNPAMCQMLGYTEDELKRITVRDIHPDDVLRRAASEFEAHEWGNIPIMGQDVACLKKDGTIIYTDLAATPIFIDGSAHSVVFFMDITERKKAEEEKKKIEAQLFQSQKLEAVGRLTGGIAHDFNNILTTIIGNSEIILAGLPKGDPTREGVEEISAAGDRAVSLIGQLLAFSRKQVLQPTVMSLNETVRDMDRMLSRIIGENVEMRTIHASDLGLVEADMGRVEQVIMNLVVNARDSMPKGGKITIETGNVDLDEEYAGAHIAVIPGPHVMLSVSDTGVGMTREVQEQIFDPFFTTKEEGKGTGLGLSTVYGIVKQSNGNIWVYSEPGKGTTFKIYLPRVEKPICAKEKKDKKAGAVTGSETILLVEDDEMVRNFTARVLKKFGYMVLLAADGGEAVRISRDHEGPIHLMLTDVVMPGLSGHELEENIKRILPGIKVLYMSGYTDDAIVHHGVLDLEKAFLQKPFTLDSLGRKVREVLGD